MISSPGFVSALLSSAAAAPGRWFVLSLCPDGAIGKAFHDGDLASFASAVRALGDKAPADYVVWKHAHHLATLCETTVCLLEDYSKT